MERVLPLCRPHVCRYVDLLVSFWINCINISMWVLYHDFSLLVTWRTSMCPPTDSGSEMTKKRRKTKWKPWRTRKMKGRKIRPWNMKISLVVCLVKNLTKSYQTHILDYNTMILWLIILHPIACCICVYIGTYFLW